jgi:hypothetical protein
LNPLAERTCFSQARRLRPPLPRQLAVLHARSGPLPRDRGAGRRSGDAGAAGVPAGDGAGRADCRQERALPGRASADEAACAAGKAPRARLAPASRRQPQPAAPRRSPTRGCSHQRH